jgi:UDPglucose 6-dehydrogenase
VIDINETDFITNFDLSKATVGVIGFGYIGNAVNELFKPFCKTVVYDKAKALDTLEEVVEQSEIIFVAVPTPMKSNGQCHTGVVDAVLQDITNAASCLKRPKDAFIVVIKSTVPPGYIDNAKLFYGLRIVFSPEFLTERNAVEDFKNADRVLLGGDPNNIDIVYQYFRNVWKDRNVRIVSCSAIEAEMVKLSTNAHLMARVLLSNELYLICKALNVDYECVKQLTQLDKRIGSSHMDVPGPDGKLGAGGHCFPKDISSLAYVSSQLRTKEKLFTAIIERNREIRPERDWEAMKGRAVIERDDECENAE